jgi:hypothetical protein
MTACWKIPRSLELSRYQQDKHAARCGYRCTPTRVRLPPTPLKTRPIRAFQHAGNMATCSLPDVYNVLVCCDCTGADVLSIPGYVCTAPFERIHMVLAFCASPADNRPRLWHCLRVWFALHHTTHASTCPWKEIASGDASISTTVDAIDII